MLSLALDGGNLSYMRLLLASMAATLAASSGVDNVLHADAVAARNSSAVTLLRVEADFVTCTQ